MRKAKRWRYYCDFCNKSGGSKYHMQGHEPSCTMNPKRTCRMCGIQDEPSGDLEKMIRIIKNDIYCVEDELEMEAWLFGEDKKEEATLAAIRSISDCPACILAAIRQAGIPFMFQSFDYKKEKEAFWSDFNDSRADGGPSACGWDG